MSESNVSEPARLARLMGLSRPQSVDALSLVRQVEKGLPVQSAYTVIRAISPEAGSARDRLMSKATWSRLQNTPNGRLSRELSDRVYVFSRVVDAALRLWGGDRAAAHLFLSEPHPMLDNRAPYEVAEGGAAGAELVLRLIGRAEAGVAA